MEIANIVISAASCIAAISAVVVALYVNYQSKLPDVAVYLEHDRDHASKYLVVRNFGKGIARNVELEGFDYEMTTPSLRPSLKNSFIERGIPLLAPNAERNTVIQAGRITREHGDNSCLVTISYSEDAFIGKSKTVKQEFTLDFYSFAGSIYSLTDVHEMKTQMTKISKTMNRIERDLNHMNSHLRQLYSNESDSDQLSHTK